MDVPICVFCLVMLVFALGESSPMRHEFEDLKLQVEQLMEYQKVDSLKIEMLMAGRNEDRRQLETLNFAVENFHESIDKLIEEKQQNEEQIKELSDIVEQIIQDNVRDLKVIEDLQKMVNEDRKQGGTREHLSNVNGGQTLGAKGGNMMDSRNGNGPKDYYERKHGGNVLDVVGEHGEKEHNGDNRKIREHAEETTRDGQVPRESNHHNDKEVSRFKVCMVQYISSPVRLTYG